MHTNNTSCKVDVVIIIARLLARMSFQVSRHATGYMALLYPITICDLTTYLTCSPLSGQEKTSETR